jgi:hypothetical protein
MVPPARFEGIFRSWRVGFGVAFGVKLAVPWAVEARLKPRYDGVKHFK